MPDSHLTENRIYLGIKSRVVCIDRRTGEELWRTQMKKNDGLTTIMVSGEYILAYSRGVLHGLSTETGAVLWTNDLPGLGYGYCLIASATGGNDQAASLNHSASAQQNEAAVTAALTAYAASSAARVPEVYNLNQ